MEAAGYGQHRTRRVQITGHLCSSLIIVLLLMSLAQGAQGSWNQTGCGKQLVSGRILNGQNAKDGAWPWLVSVQKNGSHYCGGSLIAASWVVTAAHCFNQPVDISKYRVQLGEKRIFDQSINGTFSSVKRVILNPLYNATTFQADIALVELENPIEFTAAISPLCLLDASVRVPAGKPCWMTGWGFIIPELNVNSRPGTLQEVEVLTVDSTICNNLFREALKKPAGYNPIKDDMMCAGSMEGLKGFSEYDTGGPLMCEEDGTWYFAGIASWYLMRTANGASSIAAGYPEVYNRPNAHNKWIQENVPGVTFTTVNFPVSTVSPTTPDTANRAAVPGALLLMVLLWLSV